MSRRGLFAAGAGVAVAAALPAVLPAGRAHAATALSRVDAAFLRRGLIHGAWTPQSGSGRWEPSAALWKQSGFTTPTFYDPPLYNRPLLDGLPGYTWAAAKGPAGTHLTVPPDLSVPILTADQRTRAGDLFSMCFGDEENYSANLESWLVSLFAKLRQEAPGALCHTNQYAGQWSDAQLRSYMARAQPDLLTWDSYYFSMNSAYAGGSVTPLYDATARYRRLALAGNDQTSAHPIGFGQYTMGFRSGSGPAVEGGQYIVSESEQSIVSYVTWALGGKWLNLFRWEKDAHPTSLLMRKDGSNGTTEQFNRYVTLNSRRRTLSPYLTRLRSKRAFIVPGRNPGGQNPQPSLDVFAPHLDPEVRIRSVSAANDGGANGGLPGDVVIGTFRPIPGMSAEESAGIFTDPATPAFMVVNALAVPNTDKTSETGVGGRGQDTGQTITLTFDLSDGSVRPDQLRMLNAATGAVVTPSLIAKGAGIHELRKYLWGGTGDLFWWQL